MTLDSPGVPAHDPAATWGALLQGAIGALEAARLPEARRHATWMLAEVLGAAPAHLVAYPERRATAAQRAALEAMLARRLRGEPLQYVLGFADFFGLRLRVTPAVLIPRPETEQVVEAALGLLRTVEKPRVLDVGTGSGCIALALKFSRPEADVHACDISAEALAVARENAAALDLDVRFFQADMLSPGFADPAPGSLDLLISNPPYVPDAEAVELAPEVREHEPPLALFAGADPLRFYRALAAHAKKLLAPGGVVIFETHATHGPDVRRLLEAEGFSAPMLHVDLAGRPRIVYARRTS